MALTYRTSRQVTEEKTLRIPTEWGMFSSQGNKRITQIAQEASDRIEKLCAEAKYGCPSKKDVRQELVRMLTKWVRMWDTKTYPESSDSAVRDGIGWFTDKLAVASGAFSKFDTSSLWYEVYDEAQQNVRS